MLENPELLCTTLHAVPGTRQFERDLHRSGLLLDPMGSVLARADDVSAENELQKVKQSTLCGLRNVIMRMVKANMVTDFLNNKRL